MNKVYFKQNQACLLKNYFDFISSLKSEKLLITSKLQMTPNTYALTYDN